MRRDWPRFPSPFHRTISRSSTAAQEATGELQGGIVSHGTNVSKVSVVGCGMRMNTGVASQMFRALAEANINIGLITTSDIKISVLVDRDQALAAVAAVHRGFQLEKEQHPSQCRCRRPLRLPVPVKSPARNSNGMLFPDSPIWKTSWSAKFHSMTIRPA